MLCAARENSSSERNLRNAADAGGDFALGSFDLSNEVRAVQVFHARDRRYTKLTSDSEQDRRIAHVLTIDEVGLEQPLRDLVLNLQTLFQGCRKQHMTAKGVRCTLHQVVMECDSDLRPGSRDLCIVCNALGMSADYLVAIEEGSTIVRIGTAIFGERPARG